MVAQGRPGQGSDHNTSKHPELDGMPRCCRIATHGTSGLLQTHAPVLARCQCYRYDLCLSLDLSSSSTAYRHSVGYGHDDAIPCLLIAAAASTRDKRAEGAVTTLT